MANFNGVDAALLVLVALHAWRARRHGCWHVGVGLVGGVGSLIVAAALARPLAGAFDPAIPVPSVWGPPLAFLALWSGMQGLGQLLTPRLVRRPRAHRAPSARTRRLALIPGALHGVVTGGLLLTVLTIAPVPEFLPQAIRQSALANPLVQTIRTLERPLDAVFGPAAQEVRAAGPGDARVMVRESMELSFRVPLPTAAPDAEERMIDLLNLERSGRGLPVLVVDPALRDVARAHALDLLQQGYFAHTGRDGRSPFDRMHAAGIRYSTAGENLALGATTDDAEAGLLSSPSHRANILNPRFVRIGVGTMDGGRNGKMFVQEFTD